MRLLMKFIIFLAVALAEVWIVTAPCAAHHLWVMESDGAYSVCRGSINERTDPYDPSCVAGISALAADGTEIPVSRKDDKTQAVFTTTQQPALVTVVSKWGNRVNTTRGKKLMSREKAEAAGLTVISAFMSTQFSKTVFTPSGINSQPVGLKFEIIPLVDPMTLAPGTPAAFKLLFDGRPLRGVSVFSNHDQKATTDANGMVQFSFEKSGVHLLYAIHKTPSAKDSGLDFFKFMSFLTFEVKE